MARKGSGLAIGGLALVIAVILGAIAKYAMALLVIGGVVVALWFIYKLFFAKKDEASPPPQGAAEPVVPPPPLRRTWGTTPTPPVTPAVTPVVTRFVNRSVEARVPTPGPSNSDADAYWLVRGRSVALAGRALGGGIYFGTGLQSVQRLSLIHISE